MDGMDKFLHTLIEEYDLGSLTSFHVSKPQLAVTRDLKTFMQYLNRRGTGSIIVED
jgi:hypothetical protein